MYKHITQKNADSTFVYNIQKCHREIHVVWSLAGIPVGPSFFGGLVLFPFCVFERQLHLVEEHGIYLVSSTIFFPEYAGSSCISST